MEAGYQDLNPSTLSPTASNGVFGINGSIGGVRGCEGAFLLQLEQR